MTAAQHIVYGIAISDHFACIFLCKSPRPVHKNNGILSDTIVAIIVIPSDRAAHDGIIQSVRYGVCAEMDVMKYTVSKNIFCHYSKFL